MRFRETAGTVVGKPASITPRRPILAPCSPAWVTVPFMTSSIFSGSIPERSMRPWRAWASRASGRVSRKTPPLRPKGVRTASRITGSLMLSPLIAHNGQCDTARVSGVVEYPLVGHLRTGRTQSVLASVEVAVPAGEAAGSYLHPDVVPGLEGDPGSPQVYRVLVHLAGLYQRWLDRVYDAKSRVALPDTRPDDPIGHPDRPPVRINVHEPRHEVRIQRRGRHVECCVHRSYGRVIFLENLARKDEHVWPLLVRALVSCSRRVD